MSTPRKSDTSEESARRYFAARSRRIRRQRAMGEAQRRREQRAASAKECNVVNLFPVLRSS